MRKRHDVLQNLRGLQQRIKALYGAGDKTAQGPIIVHAARTDIVRLKKMIEKEVKKNIKIPDDLEI